MTTFQRLVLRGFEEGTINGIERQKIMTIRKMYIHDMSIPKIAEILEMTETEVNRLLAKK